MERSQGLRVVAVQSQVFKTFGIASTPHPLRKTLGTWQVPTWRVRELGMNFNICFSTESAIPLRSTVRRTQL